MEGKQVPISPNLIRSIQQFQQQLRYPNPQYSVKAPFLPIYLAEINPLHPKIELLKELDCMQLLNQV